MIRSSIGHQRGRTLLGFIVGLVVGLGVAVAVALYITNAPVPFVNKFGRLAKTSIPAQVGSFPIRTSRCRRRPADPTSRRSRRRSSTQRLIPKAAPPPPEKGVTPVPDDGTRYLLQAGAFRTPEDADAMRARLALLGFDAKVFPRDQDGQTLYRVRLGPYGNIEDVNRMRKTMTDNGIEAQLIKVR